MSNRDEPATYLLDSDELVLSRRDAFLVMSDFVWRFAQEAGDDLLTLLGDTEIESDGLPGDPAAWTDWIASVAKIKAGRAPRS